MLFLFFKDIEGVPKNLQLAKKDTTSVCQSNNLQFFFYPHETWSK